MKEDHFQPLEPSDERLCALAASGDRQAEEDLVVRYNRLVRICARPYFLAGGLHPGNAAAAAELRPYAVDVSSGIETEGVKDRQKMIEFVRRIRHTF